MYYVYIITNKYNRVIYTGITNNLERRMYEYRHNTDKKSFTYRYNIKKLVYFEEGQSAEGAIRREKQIKGYVRQKKLDIINKMNPEWKDLSADWSI